MQEKVELFNKLPRGVIQGEMARFIDVTSLVKLAMTSKTNWTFFKPILKPILDVQRFLHHVVHGEHDAVQLMLKNDMSLIFKRGSVTDYSGRTFEDISGIEYALWALDEPMWTMMRECIPQNEEGKKVLEQMLLQYNKVNTDGVTYRYDGRTITESHFDFKNTIIKELQKQVNSTRALGRNKDWNAINYQWINGVGGAQKSLPLSVVFECCSGKPYNPVHEFTSLPIKLSQQFYNWTTEKDEDWFARGSKLGIDFAIYVYNSGGAAGFAGGGGACEVEYMLNAMRALLAKRTKGFTNLKSQLEEQNTVDNQPQFF